LGKGGVPTSSGGIESRTLRVQLPMMVRSYGAQETDCISPPSANIPPEEVGTPPHVTISCDTS